MYSVSQKYSVAVCSLGSKRGSQVSMTILLLGPHYAMKSDRLLLRVYGTVVRIMEQIPAWSFQQHRSPLVIPVAIV